jgi:hypothetical protein
MSTNTKENPGIGWFIDYPLPHSVLQRIFRTPCYREFVKIHIFSFGLKGVLGRFSLLSTPPHDVVSPLSSVEWARHWPVTGRPMECDKCTIAMYRCLRCDSVLR